MWDKLKAHASNIILVSVSCAALIFTMIATWVILHRSAEIIRTLPASMHAVIGGTLAIGLLLIWLNSMLVDSIVWMATRYWISTKGIKDE